MSAVAWYTTAKTLKELRGFQKSNTDSQTMQTITKNKKTEAKELRQYCLTTSCAILDFKILNELTGLQVKVWVTSQNVINSHESDISSLHYVFVVLSILNHILGLKSCPA